MRTLALLVAAAACSTDIDASAFADLNVSDAWKPWAPYTNEQLLGMFCQTAQWIPDCSVDLTETLAKDVWPDLAAGTTLCGVCPGLCAASGRHCDGCEDAHAPGGNCADLDSFAALCPLVATAVPAMLTCTDELATNAVASSVINDPGKAPPGLTACNGCPGTCAAVADACPGCAKVDTTVLPEGDVEALRGMSVVLGVVALGDDPCTWDYVACHDGTYSIIIPAKTFADDEVEFDKAFGTGHFTMLTTLAARNAGFKGTLPDSLAEATKMKVFDIAQNHITGPLPKAYAAWTELTDFAVFGLGDNEGGYLTGTLPVEYAAWTKLTRFSAGTQGFEGPIPAEYAAWTQLSWFAMDHNQRGRISGPLPPALSAWTEMSHFDVARNSLTGPLPASYSAWSNLKEFFDADDNQLTGPIPPEYASWEGLDKLYLHNNKLTGAVPELHAKYLYAEGNCLTSVGPLPRTTRLKLQDNNIAALPDAPSALLGYAELAGNPLAQVDAGWLAVEDVDLDEASFAPCEGGTGLCAEPGPTPDHCLPTPDAGGGGGDDDDSDATSLACLLAVFWVGI